MDFNTFCNIDSIVKKYTDGYMLGNRSPDLAVILTALVNDEEKEYILNDLDKELPYGLYFSHEYENGKLKIVFKEVSQ